MQQKQKQIRSADRVGRPLWEVICSTVLTNPAEQNVVQQVIGETLIQESEFLHREALALHDILSAVEGKHIGIHEPQRNVTKQSSLTLVKHKHSEDNPADPRLHPRRSIHRKDGSQSAAPSANASEKMDKEQLPSRTSVSGLKNKLKTPDGDADILSSQNKAKKDIDGMSRLRKSVTYGDGTHRVPKHGHGLRPPPQRSISSSSSSASSEKTQTAIRSSNVAPPLVDQNVDSCVNDIPPMDFSEFLHDRGAQINAYDIDEVVHELRDAFATERVYLNQLVEQLRRALDDYIESYTMVNIKFKSNDPKDIKEKIDVANIIGNSKPVLTAPVTRTSKHVGHAVQRPTPPSPQAAHLSRPSLIPIKKSSKLEKTASKPRSVALPNATIKQLERPPLKNVVATNKLPSSPIRERRRPMS